MNYDEFKIKFINELLHDMRGNPYLTHLTDTLQRVKGKALIQQGIDRANNQTLNKHDPD